MHANVKEDSESSFNEHHGPFGSIPMQPDTQLPATISDAVRRCRWIAIDLNAAGFSLFFASPSPEKACLVPCFDSDYPGIASITKLISSKNGEDMARHARTSTQPRWWADDNIAGSDNAFREHSWIAPTSPLAPGTSGIVFPVHADHNQCGLVLFHGSKIALPENALYEIHARCFSLFAAVSRIRPGPAGNMRAISKREMECLKLTANGFTSEDIARLLKLSVHTANQYLTQSAQKLNAVSRTQAVAKALRLGLIE